MMTFWGIVAVIAIVAVLLAINVVSSYLWWEVGCATGRREAEREHEIREAAKARRQTENAAREVKWLP